MPRGRKPRTCSVCGAEFNPESRGRRTCSTECAIMAINENTLMMRQKIGPNYVAYVEGMRRRSEKDIAALAKVLEV